MARHKQTTKNKSKNATRNKRIYRQASALEVAQIEALKAITGNATQAVALYEQEQGQGGKRSYLGTRLRANYLKTLSNKLDNQEYMQKAIELSAKASIERIAQIIEQSEDDSVALSASKYMIDRQLGKPVSRALVAHGKANIESVLD